ncbi:MAG: hypothetical protein LQ345_001213 [Seirophora villosa]|nr:MAG: hypothetical protein LQ345_001213 [Seirophora villosa]
MNPSTPAPVSNPLRILVLTTSPSTPPPALLKGSDLPIQTPYYSATIPIWHDAITSPQEWEREWLSPSASEVIQSIGAWVLTFPKPSSAQSEAALETIRSTLLTIHRVLSHHHHHDNNNNTLSSYNEPPLLLALGMPQPQRPVLAMTDESWEDLCRACGGWEWIDVEARGENAFGEKVGGERLREALEANVWDGIAGGEGDEEEDIDAFEAELRLRGDDDGGLELGMREAILKRQSTGDKDADTPAEDEGEEDDETTDKDIQVEELESMMLKMQAIKADERRRFAAKAVTEVMKTAVM